MELKANVNFDRFEEKLQVVDAHTVGEFCRMVIGGFPEPEGNTMIENKKWLEENYDHAKRTPRYVRRILLQANQRRSGPWHHLYGHRRIFKYVRPLYHRRRYRCNRGWTC